MSSKALQTSTFNLRLHSQIPGHPTAKQLLIQSRGLQALPTGSIVVPVCGLYLGSYKVIPKKGTTMEPMGRL